MNILFYFKRSGTMRKGKIKLTVLYDEINQRIEVL